MSVDSIIYDIYAVKSFITHTVRKSNQARSKTRKSESPNLAITFKPDSAFIILSITNHKMALASTIFCFISEELLCSESGDIWIK